jgi:CrcB protein
VTIFGYLSIALGGAFGAVLRYAISTVAQNQIGGFFPWGTLAVNLIGSFLIGVLFQLFHEQIGSENMRLILITGGLGAFTTFSTYSLETLLLFQDGKVGLGLLNLALSSSTGLIAVFMGIYLVRFIVGSGSS